jgi:hypothetical protein
MFVYNALNCTSFMMRKITLLFSLFFVFNVLAQDVPIGGWKEHLSYKSALSVVENNGKIYCATKSGVFILNKSDNSLERLSKVNGLSDVEPSVLNYNSYNNKLFIAYKNSNIDIVANGTVTNISDIERKSIVGNKAINNIFFINEFAYLACGFGIVVIDMERLEVKDTYYIGPNGDPINVTDITSDGSYLYASTSAGVYKGKLSSNLSNFVNWNQMDGLRTAYYNTLAISDGKLYANFSKYFTNGNTNQDTLFVCDLNNLSLWSLFHPGASETNILLREKSGQLIIVQWEKVLTSSGGVYQDYISPFHQPKSATIDNTGNIWIADAINGLVTFDAASGYSSHYPNGPASEKLFNMTISESNLWVAPGGLNNYFVDGLYFYSDGEWKNPRGNYPGYLNLDTIADFVNTVIDPNNPRHVYAASWGKGLVEFYNEVPVRIHDISNSAIKGINYSPDYNPIWIYGLAFDANNNLWVANSGVTASLAVRSIDGTWQSIDFGYISVSGVQQLSKIIVDKNDQKWFIISKYGEGLAVYKGGITATADASNTKKLTTAAGNGALPSLTVFDIAEDKDGEIWIGTDKGVAVFYSPENVFTGQNFDAQQILLEQDGHVQILLETEAVQAIAVDDANRKWIGTAKSGAFLMSSDGTKEIFHFDASNSPLFSNNVKCISIDHKTGEVYFGTDKGIISYRGNAIEGNECFKDVYSFPNPVRPDYSGPIAIKGLVDNTTVKITDISGTLVYETKSEGGQAIWYGKNFKGEKVSTGVYMVFCSSENTDCQKAATKILFIN